MQPCELSVMLVRGGLGCCWPWDALIAYSWLVFCLGENMKMVNHIYCCVQMNSRPAEKEGEKYIIGALIRVLSFCQQVLHV